MELAFRSRGNTKLSGQDKKHWFKQAAAPLIGDDLAFRKKQMFTVPIGEWFRTSSFDWLAGTLQKSELITHCFQWSAVDSMLKAHREGSANYTRELRALVAMALWADGAEVGA
jgi:asparagine synthase (glutamine-hydrolysing)